MSQSIQALVKKFRASHVAHPGSQGCPDIHAWPVDSANSMPHMASAQCGMLNLLIRVEMDWFDNSESKKTRQIHANGRGFVFTKNKGHSLDGV